MKRKFLALTLCCMLALAGCGSSPSGTNDPAATGELTGPTVTGETTDPAATLSGVAAAGAPLVGNVFLKDSAGTVSGPVQLASDGSFNFNVDGLIPPFFLRAQGLAGGSSFTIHSLAVRPGTANITPLTEAVVAAATGQNPTDVYDTPSIDTNTIEAALDQAATDIATMLQPLLDAYNTQMTNPITDTLVADHTGLDAVMDAVKVEVNVATNAITCSDVNGVEVASGDISGGAITITEAIDSTEVDDAVAINTELAQIAAFISEWLTQMKATTAAYDAGNITAAVAESQILAYYNDVSYGFNDGYDLNSELADDLSDGLFWQLFTEITHLSIVEKNGNEVVIAGFATLTESPGKSVTFDISSDKITLINLGDAITPDWRITGNNRMAGFYADITHSNHILQDGTSIKWSGIKLDIEDPQGTYAYAIVNGPGLGTGVTYTTNPNDTYMQPPAELIPVVVTDQYGTTNEWNYLKLDDATINAMSNTPAYTTEFYNGADQLIETQTIVLASKPLLAANLTDAHFPYWTNQPTTLDLAYLNNNFGSTISVQYTPATAIEQTLVDFDWWGSAQDASGIWTGLNVEDVFIGTTTMDITFPGNPGTYQYMGGSFAVDGVSTGTTNYEFETTYHVRY